MTVPEDMLAHNRQLIAQFRADGGASMKDRPLLLLTTRGRRTGEPRISPMMYLRADDRLLVIASNNGAGEDPLWYRNLVADPQVTVELPGSRFAARAEPLTGVEYEREWARVTSEYPFFLEHRGPVRRPPNPHRGLDPNGLTGPELEPVRVLIAAPTLDRRQALDRGRHESGFVRVCNQMAGFGRPVMSR